MQRDQHAWMLSQLQPLDDAGRQRVERLLPRLNARMGRAFPGPRDDAKERASYAMLGLILSIQQHPDRPDGRHIGTAMLRAREFTHDEARAWGVNRRQADGPRRTNWRPLSLSDVDYSDGLRRIEDCEVGDVDA